MTELCRFSFCSQTLRSETRKKIQSISAVEHADIVFPEKTKKLNGKTYAIYGGGRPKNLDALPFPDWDVLSKDPNNKDILENYINTPIWGKDAKNSSATSFSMERSISL